MDVSKAMMRILTTLSLSLVVLGLVSACSALRCDSVFGDRPLVSIVYASGDAVGISQELHYYSSGQLRFVGTDWNTYCGLLSTQAQRELHKLLDDPDLTNELKRFGDILRLPDHFIPETLKITYGPTTESARIDALHGVLFQLVRILDQLAAEEFGGRYQLSLIRRLEQLEHAAQADTAPR